MSENNTERPNALKVGRDYTQEKVSKVSNLAHRMAEVAQARLEATTRELMQVAQVLCFTGLPYRRTADRALVRRARTSSGDTITVTFRAMIDGIDIPFGTDRSLLHWITHRAVVTKNPFIPISSASEYLRDMGMSASGPNIKRVREAFQRIASFAIVVQRETGASSEQLIMPIIQAARMPRSLRSTPKGAQLPLLPPSGDEQGFTLSEAVFREFMQYHVPTLAKMIEVTRESPQTQDCMLFLQWRSFAAKSETCIPWDALRQQLWNEDSNPWRIKGRFEEAIKALQIAWPQLNARATTRGLEIGPPHRGEQFLPGTSN